MSTALKEISIAHSPDSDDAFMFYALANQHLDCRGLKIKQVHKDIQTLNQEALRKAYDISAISFAVYPLIAKDYALMPCGASMGFKYGPMVVARQGIKPEQLKKARIAIPGRHTTACLVLRLYEPGLDTIEMPFNRIFDAVRNGEVDAGLIIHEGQLTYKQLGLTKIIDLGEWWHDQTGLPLPLGGNVIRRDLGQETIARATELIKEAIVYAIEHRTEALDYAMTFAAGMDKPLADKYVGMYVNELTVDCGQAGRQAVKTLFDMAYQRGLLPEPVVIDFVEI